jgi:diacylglycerol kinase family enzyme
LGLPLDLVEAAKVVVDGKTVEVDVAEVNGKTFLNNSIVGLYPIYRFLKAKHERRIGNKRLAMLMAAASVFWRYPSLRIGLYVNGVRTERRTPYILVGNNRHAMEGYRLGFRDTMTEGKLWIYVMKHHGRWGLLRMLFRLVTGRLRGEEEFDIFPAEEIWVEANRGKRIGVALDGEVAVMETPLHYRILPRSLKVRVPKEQP